MSENVKQALAELVEQLPDDCTWDEVMERIYVRQKITEGLQAVEEGRVVEHEEVVRQTRQWFRGESNV